MLVGMTLLAVFALTAILDLSTTLGLQLVTTRAQLSEELAGHVQTAIVANGCASADGAETTATLAGLLTQQTASAPGTLGPCVLATVAGEPLASGSSAQEQAAVPVLGDLLERTSAGGAAVCVHSASGGISAPPLAQPAQPSLIAGQVPPASLSLTSHPLALCQTTTLGLATLSVHARWLFGAQPNLSTASASPPVLERESVRVYWPETLASAGVASKERTYTYSSTHAVPQVLLEEWYSGGMTNVAVLVGGPHDFASLYDASSGALQTMLPQPVQYDGSSAWAVLFPFVPVSDSIEVVQDQAGSLSPSLVSLSAADQGKWAIVGAA